MPEVLTQIDAKPEEPPPHPYWCDDCGAHASFTIPGCGISHKRGCTRYGEDPRAVYDTAFEYCVRTGKTIK